MLMLGPEVFRRIFTKKLVRIFPMATIMTAKSKYPDEKENAKHPSSIVFMGSTIKPLSVLIGLKEKLLTAR